MLQWQKVRVMKRPKQLLYHNLKGMIAVFRALFRRNCYFSTQPSSDSSRTSSLMVGWHVAELIGWER